MSVRSLERRFIGLDSVRFVRQLYPDLIPPDSPRAQAALANNIGTYVLCIIEIETECPDRIKLLQDPSS